MAQPPGNLRYHCPAEQMTYAEALDGLLITRVFHEIPVDSRVGLFRACYRALKRSGGFLNLDFAYPDTLAEFREPLFWSGWTINIAR